MLVVVIARDNTLATPIGYLGFAQVVVITSMQDIKELQHDSFS